MKNQNLAFIDIETTGLLLDKHEIIEIGCVLVSQGSPGAPKFKKLEEFEIKFLSKLFFKLVYERALTNPTGTKYLAQLREPLLFIYCRPE